MWRKRGWAAVLAIWTILGNGLGDDKLLRSDRNASAIIGIEDNRGSRETNHFAGPTTTTKTSGTVNPGNDELGIDRNEVRIAPEANNIGARLTAKEIVADSGATAIRGNFLPGARENMLGLKNRSLGQFSTQSRIEAALSGEPHNFGSEFGAAIEFIKSSQDLKRLTTGNEKASSSPKNTKKRLKENSRVTTSAPSKGRSKTQLVYTDDNRVQRGARTIPEMREHDNAVETVDNDDFKITITTAAPLRAQTIPDNEVATTTENFYNSNDPQVRSTMEVNIASYVVTQDPRRAKGGAPLKSAVRAVSPAWLHQEVSRENRVKMTGRRLKTAMTGDSLTKVKRENSNDEYPTNYNEGKYSSGARLERPTVKESTGRSRGMIDASAAKKIFFNENKPIGLNAVNYPGYIETELLDSNVDRRPAISEYREEVSTWRADVEIDMRREGHAAATADAVENEPAYSDITFASAEIPGSTIRQFGLSGASHVKFPGISLNAENSRPIKGKSIKTSGDNGPRGLARVNVEDNLALTNVYEGTLKDEKFDDEQQQDLQKLASLWKPMKSATNDESLSNQPCSANDQVGKFQAFESSKKEMIGSMHDAMSKGLIKDDDTRKKRKNEGNGKIIIGSADAGYAQTVESVRNGETAVVKIRQGGAGENSFGENSFRENKGHSDERCVEKLEIISVDINQTTDSSRNRQIPAKVERSAADGKSLRSADLLANQSAAYSEITRPMMGQLSESTYPDEVTSGEGDSGPFDKSSAFIHESAVKDETRNNGIEIPNEIDRRDKSNGSLSALTTEVINESKFIIVPNSRKVGDKEDPSEVEVGAERFSISMGKIPENMDIEDEQTQTVRQLGAANEIESRERGRVDPLLDSQPVQSRGQSSNTPRKIENEIGGTPSNDHVETSPGLSGRSLIARLSNKYLESKKNQGKESPSAKDALETARERIIERPTYREETASPAPPNLENHPTVAHVGAPHVWRQEISTENKFRTTYDTGTIFHRLETPGTKKVSGPEVTKDNTYGIFTPSFNEKVMTTVKISSESKRLFSGGEYTDGANKRHAEEDERIFLPRFGDSTEISVSRKDISALLHGVNAAFVKELPGASDLPTIENQSNQTYSNSDTKNNPMPKRSAQLGSTSRNWLEGSGSVTDSIDRDAQSSFVESRLPTEIPLQTVPDTSGAITLNLNAAPSLSFNQTDSENASRVASPLNQWPVKHSAVVEGDLVLGGLMMVHEREDSVTCGPVMPQGGVQALEAMLYTLDRLNQEEIIPGVKIGAHILDDCDKDTYGLEMAVDFIKGSISNIDGAEYHCNKTAVRKVISGVVGAASSVTSIQVANLLRLFRIPQVSFFSTSPELSNKQRFEYFTRTIPSDHYQVKAMVDIVRKMNWSYVSIIYEESNYGIKAFEELEELLAKYDICIAIKEKLVKDSGVADETAYDSIVQKLLTKPRARGCIIFGSDQEVAGVMRAVRRCNATGSFSWIGSDGWSARGLVSDGNEPEVEGTLSVQPQANPVKGFEDYFLDLTVENNRRNPWFVEFWEDHFQCRYPNASWTPYNQKYTKPCTTRERLTKQTTAFEGQLQYVSDAVTAFAYAFRDMHEALCHGKPGLCDAMKPTKGTELLKYLRKVDFEGLSGDKFRFDKNGDGPARYNIIHFKQASRGKYKWVRVGEYIEGELRLDMSEIQFRLGHPLPPESVCSLPCEVGQAKKYVEGESCCWHCFNCTQYQVRHPLDETQCIPCPQGRVPDKSHSNCRDIPEEFLRPESGWAIGAMSFSATGILVTLFVGGVFLRHNDTPVVRASGRELSYVLLTGILLCYLVTFALVLRPNDVVCGIQRFGAGFCFTVVYAALLTKTNRIARIFNAGKQSAKRPSFISPRSQLIICSGLVGVQILVNGVWMIIDPARAMHHYPTREDNLLVCSSYIDASYMIAFSYPIILIVVCTVYAVLTRKIPEAFNESKHIGFTMYTTCVIWLAFVPLYFGTGNHVALRITSMSVTISLSASVTIACLFSPKLYIILIRPERNVRQSMMPIRYSTTKSSAVSGTNASSMMAAVTLTAATCDQNKAVKRHVTTTMDCSTQSEHYEMEEKDNRICEGTPPARVSRSTQTTQTIAHQDCDAAIKITGGIESTKDPIPPPPEREKQLNNLRIGNGPMIQKEGAL